MKTHAHYEQQLNQLITDIILTVSQRVHQTMPAGGRLVLEPQEPILTEHPGTKRAAMLIGYECQDEDQPVYALIITNQLENITGVEAFKLDHVNCDALLVSLLVLEQARYKLEGSGLVNPVHDDEDDF